MKPSLPTVLLFASFATCQARGPFRQMLPENIPKYARAGEDPGKPLFLTPYILAGKPEEAHNLSRVGDLSGTSVLSYAGLFTVNSTYNSNTFFWFIPAEVGTGFSFTDDDAGYATNEDDVAANLYSCLTQFFQVFPEYQKNDFYASGESYGGKYVPAIGVKIHQENPGAKVKINFRGVMIGDGWSDPESMIPVYPELMYQTSQIDETQKKVAEQYVQEAVKYIKQQHWLKADQVLNEIFNSFWSNATGSSDQYNYLRTTSPPEFNYYIPYLAKGSVRNAIHVGNLTFHSGAKVELFLLRDVVQSVKERVTVLADNYKVVIRGGGHIVPFDQPERSFDMIDRFITGRPFHT